MAKIAFLGLGVMGHPMAGHLLKKGGHDVTVYNRTAAKAQQWAKEYGGRHAATPRDAGKDCDFVMMCVGNDDDVRSVVYGDNRALAVLLLDLRQRRLQGFGFAIFHCLYLFF